MIDWRVADIERRERNLQLSKAESESVSVTGMIAQPDAFIPFRNCQLPVQPVYVTIHNTGDIPAKIVRIDFEVFCSTVANVAKVSSLGLPAKVDEDGILLSSNSPEKPDVCIPELLGVIEANSSNWIKVDELSHSMTFASGRIPAGQTRTEKFHLLGPYRARDSITKVQVTVKSEAGEYRWFTYANPAMCAPGPAAAAITE